MGYDVIVIGTGPSGSVSAACLAEAGFRVLALEKEIHPRTKPCGGCISKRIDNYFDLSKLGVIEHLISGVVFTFCGREKQSFTTSRPAAYMVDRRSLDHALVREARNKGAVIIENCRVTNIHKVKEGFLVDTDEGSFQCRIVIGADGANGITRKLTARGERHRVYMAVERHLKNDSFLHSLGESLVIELGRVSAGYGWIFPHSDYLSVGIAGIRGRNTPLKKKLGLLLEAMQMNGEGFQTRAHPICSFIGRTQSLTSGEIVRVGEAGGLTDPFLGEGIFQAIRSGQLAGHYIGEYLNGAKDALWRYERHIEREFYLEFRRAAQLSRMVFAFPRYFYRNLAKRPHGIEIFFSILRGEETYNNLFWMALRWLGLQLVPPQIRRKLPPLYS